MDDRDYQTLSNIVCERVPGMTTRDWRDASEGQRVACMESALRKLKQAEPPPDRASPPEEPSSESVAVAAAITGPPQIGPPPTVAQTEPAVVMTWQSAAERLERLRAQGEPWTSYHKLAKRLNCSSGTVHKAIRQTPELQSWAKRLTGTVVRATSINEVVTDRIPQCREPDPKDDAAIREYLERDNLTPDERAFFNGLSREHQLFFLDDPDKHRKVLGRKP